MLLWILLKKSIVCAVHSYNAFVQKFKNFDRIYKTSLFEKRYLPYL